ncbi:ankyrin repeat domain-containing protein [Deinococcus sp. QL22]|uniref:ankyrin repeat domain-containing protein n=1 Tax=Deinococcus sp. QL22 TaxID=2939437 RepID=UPI0020174D93|nr:ankyrin repeat domain-containing protein [Deinococcus sp. QL22]UQN08825.1 ankyrin repeat domain-containing protein [Deinococcus sp. QL22]
MVNLYELALSQEWERLRQEVATQRYPVEDLTNALVRAVFFQNFDVSAFLLTAGADPNGSYDGTRFPPLSAAVENAWREGVELLLAHGADINVRKYGGWTPLIHAVDVEYDGAVQSDEQPSLDLLQFLLERGADRKLRDDQGHTAADHARLYAWSEGAEFLSSV